MSFDLPPTPNPRAELEAKVTALLLGELSAEDAAHMRVLIARDDDLRELQERLSATLDLLRETAATPVGETPAQPAPLKLSPERREKLLAHFKTIAPREFVPPPKRRWSEWILVGAAAAAIAVALLMPAFSKAKNKSMRMSLVNNLRLFDSAKNQWAEEQKKSVGDVPTMKDLEPYFGHGPGEDLNGNTDVTYSLGPVGRFPTAQYKGQTVTLPDDDGKLAANKQPATVPSMAMMAEKAPTSQADSEVLKKLQARRQAEDQAQFTFAQQQIALPQSQNGQWQLSADTDQLQQNNQSVQNFSVTNGQLNYAYNNGAQAAPNAGPAPTTTLNGWQGETPASAGALADNFLTNPNSGDVGMNFSGQNEDRAGAAPANNLGVFNNHFNRTLEQSAGLPAPQAGRTFDALVTRKEEVLLEQTAKADVAPPMTAAPPASAEVLRPRSLRDTTARDKMKPHVMTQAEAEKNKQIVVTPLPWEPSTATANANFGVQGGTAGARSGTDYVAVNGVINNVDVLNNAGLTGADRELPGLGNADEAHALKNLPASNLSAASAPIASSAVSGKAARGPVEVQWHTLDGTLNGATTNIQPGAFAVAPPPSTAVAPARLASDGSIEEKFQSQPAASGVKTAAIDQSDAPLPQPALPALEPQPEVLTSVNAFTTFSLNVSDVAFKLAQASLQNGRMPDPGSMRSEEFINAFDYRDPAPAPGAPIGFFWERARDPFAHNRDFLRFSIKTAAQGRQAGRPLNLVLLLDKSGSMERADRVEIISQALRVLASQLQPGDTLSVVVFARTARLFVDGISGGEAAGVAKDLRKLTPEGGTNLEEAMRLAYATALRHYLPNGENRVVLLTDGAANLGNVDPDALKKKAETNRKQGIALDCFGVGWDGYNDQLLETLSRAGNGRYGFVNTPEEAATEFAGKLAGALRVAAADVKVQVEFNRNRVTSYRQIGYCKDRLNKEDFRDNNVKAAQIGAAEAGNALYTVEVNPAGDGPLCTVHVRFRRPGTEVYEEHQWTVPYAGTAATLDKASPAMRLTAVAAGFSEWLAGSPFAAVVTPDRLLQELRGVPQVYGADDRPARLEGMIRQARSISGK